jgi:hypothetical protein
VTGSHSRAAKVRGDESHAHHRKARGSNKTTRGSRWRDEGTPPTTHPHSYENGSRVLIGARREALAHAWHPVVRVDESDYVKAHQRKPSGVGAWAFCTVKPVDEEGDGYLHHVIRMRGTYDEAAQKAARIAVERGIDTLWVCA